MQVSRDLPVVGSRYHVVHYIGHGGMGTVYRAVDRLTGQQVALKRVTTLANGDSHTGHTGTSRDFRLALAQEFKTLASLRHPYIISVLDYGFDSARQPFFTMELLDNPQTILQGGQPLPFEAQVDLVLQMLQALAYLHRRAVIHRDLKPGNVLLVNANESPQVKVLDFGLASTPERVEEEDNVVGTIGYMAPELILSEPYTRASDLYAVGVIAYQLFTGRHPFMADDHNLDVMKLLRDVSIPIVDDLPEPIQPILLRLLVKDPSERYDDANAVIADLAAALGQPVVFESASIRESYLQAASFVGREAEFDELAAALKAAAAGNGSAWLIGGESGVGKSRLVDELRTWALVEGVLVLRGQAVMEGGTPYHLWRDILRHLCLQTRLSSLEAGVLKAIVPDIAALLKRPIADAPELAPESAHQRLLNVIIQVFSYQQTPMLVLLEDLHWAREDLGVLKALMELVGRLPLLIVGSYRHDERPDLPAQFASARLLKLERLPHDAIADLSVSMLGDAGRLAPLVEFLERETEGNVLFIIEVVRLLADEAGRLDDIDAARLPRSVLAGGMQSVLLRRLEKIPVDYRPLLKLAAISERTLDLALMQQLARRHLLVSLETWLSACADAMILEVRDNRWRFAHDKIRECLLADLRDEEYRRLNREVGIALESLYGSDPQHFRALAVHWANAGEFDKESRFSTRAAEFALQTGVVGEAIPLLERALELTPERRRRAHLHHLMGKAYYALGNIKDSGEQFQKALQFYSFPAPRRTLPLAGHFLSQVIRQGWHRLRMPRLSRLPAHDELRKVVDIYGRLLQVHIQLNEPLPGLHDSLQSLNLSEHLGVSPELVRAYASMCIAMGFIPLHSLAEFYARRCLSILDSVQADEARGWALEVMGYYRLGIAQWDVAVDHLTRARALFENIGAYRYVDECNGLLPVADHHLGDDEGALTKLTMLSEVAARRGDPQIMVLALTARAGSLTALGRADDALALCPTIDALIAANPNFSFQEHLFYQGVLVNAYWQAGEMERAWAAADECLRLTAQIPPTVPFVVDGYTNPCYFFMTQWERGNPQAAEHARRAFASLKRYARVFTLARPLLLVNRGLLEHLSGKPTQALASWRAALADAQHLNIPFHQGVALYELGRHSANDVQEDYLRAARAIFARIGAAWDMKRVDAI